MTATEQQEKYVIDRGRLSDLRAALHARISEKRLCHIFGVEEMVVRLAQLYCPEKTMILRAAALLHDLTKEYSPKEHKQICLEAGIAVSAEQEFSPKTYHALTAALRIPVEFPQFADPDILRAVRYHTTGRADMTIEESLLYLADYIDQTRKFQDCVTLREYFWGAHPETMPPGARKQHLDRTLLTSFDMTIWGLLKDGEPIAADTVFARNHILLLLSGT